jgi:hypothetical protein
LIAIVAVVAIEAIVAIVAVVAVVESVVVPRFGFHLLLVESGFEVVVPRALREARVVFLVLFFGSLLDVRLLMVVRLYGSDL